MKRFYYYLWFLLAIYLISSALFGQLSFKKEFIVGLANTNMSFTSDDSLDVGSRNSLMAGIFLELDFPRPLSVETNALYLSKGANDNSNEMSLAVRANYADKFTGEEQEATHIEAKHRALAICY